MENIKVSVIVPVYNSETYLKQCLDSIVTQTLKDIEIICINDGSTDDSGKILKEYASNHYSLTILNQKNQGAGVARNNGIRAAKGKYVIFMDSDDYYPDSDILEALYDAAELNNVLICGGEFSILFENGYVKTRFEDEELYYGYNFPREGIINYIDYQFDYGYHRFVYNRLFLLSNGIFFPSLRRFQDPPFFVMAMSKAEKFYAIKKVTYRYRLEHKVVNWNNKMIADLIEGLVMNLKLAEDMKYLRLQELTMRRLCQEYRWLIEISKNRLMDYEKTRNSISYNLGLFLTYIPRTICHVVWRNSNGY